MKHVFVLLASLLLRLSAPTGPASHPVLYAEHEAATPTVDSLAIAATARAAQLAETLNLSLGQARQLRTAAAARQQDLRAAGAENAPTAALPAVEARYQQRLVRVLSPGQFSALLAQAGQPIALPHHRNQRQTNRRWARVVARSRHGRSALAAASYE